MAVFSPSLMQGSQMLELPIGQIPDREAQEHVLCCCCFLKCWGDSAAATTAVKLLQSCPTLCDPMTAAHQAPQSMGSSRQEYWSGVPLPSPG